MTELLTTLASYVPCLIHRRLVQDPTPIAEPRSEQLSATVLFADISGFTALAEHFSQRGAAGAEALNQLLNTTFGQLIQLVQEHGGDVVKFAGDGLLALWSTSALKENLSRVTLLAAQCGLAVQEALHNAEVMADVRLSLRVGIGAGLVDAVHIGGAYGRWEFLIAGEPVVAMSTAEQQAEPGEVILSPHAWKLIETRGMGDPLPSGYVQLRSVSIPVPLRPVPHPPLPPDREAALRAYIPGAILSRLAAGQEGWLSELRLVTVLFINLPDLDHTTSLAEAQQTMRTIQTTLYRFEGSINKLNVDDKGVTLIAALGLPPLAHEDDAALGVQAAMAIRARLQELGLHSAVGIATGRAFCGSVGSLIRREYTMVGDVVNLAARLMQAADNDILCDAMTYEAARTRLAFDALSPLRLKGKANPVPVYHPVGQVQPAPHLKPSQALVGREEERAIISESLQSLLRGGKTRVVILEGEAGIGKSRLVEELRRQAQVVGVTPLMGAGDAIEQNTPYYAWRAIFWQIMGLDKLPPDPEVRRKHVLAQLASSPDLERLAPLLNTVLPLDLPENEITASMTGQVRADNIHEVLIRLLQGNVSGEEGDHPTVLILEDGHWLDSASWTLASLVSRRVHPILLFIALRPLSDPVPPEYLRFLEAPTTRQIELTNLSPQDTVSLIQQQLGVSSLPPSIVELIQEKAQGNPFFSEELAYALRDAGLILIDNGNCQINPEAGDLGGLRLPDTVQGVITSRIDRLSPSQQFTLKVASVIGRVFAFQTLRDIYPIDVKESRVEEDLVALRRLDLTPLEAPEPELSYVFRHIITREVAYNLMSFARRRELHRSVGEWYEQIYADDLAPFYPLLAHHWSQAIDERHVEPPLVEKSLYFLE